MVMPISSPINARPRPTISLHSSTFSPTSPTSPTFLNHTSPASPTFLISPTSPTSPSLAGRTLLHYDAWKEVASYLEPLDLRHVRKATHCPELSAIIREDKYQKLVLGPALGGHKERRKVVAKFESKPHALELLEKVTITPWSIAPKRAEYLRIIFRNLLQQKFRRPGSPLELKRRTLASEFRHIINIVSAGRPAELEITFTGSWNTEKYGDVCNSFLSRVLWRCQESLTRLTIDVTFSTLNSLPEVARTKGWTIEELTVRLQHGPGEVSRGAVAVGLSALTKFISMQPLLRKLVISFGSLEDTKAYYISPRFFHLGPFHKLEFLAFTFPSNFFSPIDPFKTFVKKHASTLKSLSIRVLLLDSEPNRSNEHGLQLWSNFAHIVDHRFTSLAKLEIPVLLGPPGDTTDVAMARLREAENIRQLLSPHYETLELVSLGNSTFTLGELECALGSPVSDIRSPVRYLRLQIDDCTPDFWDMLYVRFPRLEILELNAKIYSNGAQNQAEENHMMHYYEAMSRKAPYDWPLRVIRLCVREDYPSHLRDQLVATARVFPSLGVKTFISPDHFYRYPLQDFVLVEEQERMDQRPSSHFDH